jgi:Zn-finger domain-containing protein
MHELETLRGAIKVRMHLAGMELRDRWNRFERRHAELERAVRQVRDGALEALRSAMTDHRMALRDLHDDLVEDPEL